MSSINLVYSDDFEKLLKDEAEKAESMSILYKKMYEKLNKLSIFINLPIIILSSVVGFLSPLTLFNGQNIFLGGISLLIALCKTLDSYFDYTKTSETCRMTSLNYSKISKWIQLQLSLEREFRIDPADLYNIISNDLQNIRDSEPIIHNDVIQNFNKQYGQYNNVAKPAITNGLTEIKINKNSNIKDFIINTPSNSINSDLSSSYKEDKNNIKITILDKDKKIIDSNKKEFIEI